MIEVTHLSKKYGNHKAVDDLTFTVQKGKIYGFLGPNGAGKSTTMNMLTGYIAATEGDIKINGVDVLKEPEKAKKCIGYLPELPPLYTEMTVYEYLKFVAELKGIPKSERRDGIEKVMEMTQITDMSSRLIKNLSKGYKQRVGLAQAILGEPELIILDEPTVGLDPKQIIEIRELIKSLGEKHTVILSSHILSEVSAVCDQIMIMNHGRLVASDTPEGLEKQMGSSNIITLTVTGEEAKAREVLSSMEEIQEIEINAGEEGTVEINITTEGTQDIREELFYLLAENRMPILSLSMQKRSLEEIFLMLTGDEMPVDDKAEEQPAENRIPEEEEVEENVSDL